jgi:hypothetical protein
MKTLRDYTKEELIREILNKEIDIFYLENNAGELGIWKAVNGIWYLKDKF